MAGKKISFITILILLLLFSPGSHAGTFLDVKIGGGIWSSDNLGNINHSGTPADVDTDLLLKDEMGNYSFIAVEHPIPLIPNIKIRNYGLSTTGGGTVTSGFTFGTTAYTAGDTISTEMTMDHTNLTLYYELLDNILTFDLGITAMMLDGKVVVTRGGIRNSKMIDTTIPMIYYNVGISFVPTGFKFEFTGDHIDMSDGYFCGLDTKIVYEPGQFYGFEVGYRDNKFKFNGKQNLYSDIDFEGPFINVYLHF